MLIGDRAYGRLKGLKYITDNGADYIVRLKSKAFTIFKDGQQFVMRDEFNSLDMGQIGSWTVVGKTTDGIELALRICAIRKSQQEADKSIKKALRAAKKKQQKISQDSLALHKYIILATSLDQTIITRLILELYRFR